MKESSPRISTLGWLWVFQPEVVVLPLTVAGILREWDSAMALVAERTRYAREALMEEGLMVVVEKKLIGKKTGSVGGQMPASYRRGLQQDRARSLYIDLLRSGVEMEKAEK